MDRERERLAKSRHRRSNAIDSFDCLLTESRMRTTIGPEEKKEKN